MDFRHISNLQLYRSFGAVRRNAKLGIRELTELQTITKVHDYPMSDVNDQAKREIGSLRRITKMLTLRRRLLLYLRPHEQYIKRLQSIRKDLVESINEFMRPYGKNDIRKLENVDKQIFQEAMYHYSSAMDSIQRVLEVGGLLEELKSRRGVHKAYLSERAWELVKIVITAILSLMSGYIIGRVT